MSDSEPISVSQEPEAAPAESRPKKRKKLWKTLLGIACILLLVLLLLVSVALHYYRQWRSGAWQPSPEVKEIIKNIADSTELMEHARTLKGELGELVEYMKLQDTENARASRARLQQEIADTRGYLSSPLWKTSVITPGVGEDIRSVSELLDLLEDADAELIGPYLDQMERHPLSSLQEDGGLRVDLVLLYLDFFDELLPKLQVFLDRLAETDLQFVNRLSDSGDSVPLEKLLSAADDLQRYLPAVRAILGGGEDRVYVFAAQNTSEIRASGGFPGSVGIIRIENGLLTVSDFQSVYDVFQKVAYYDADVTEVEEQIFHGWMYYSWDFCFSPDFERTASVWAMAYELRHGEHVDGVISATPAVIPRLLSILGSITLSEGTELNGENAGRMLGHDLYFKYLGVNHDRDAYNYMDDLFTEVARKTLDLLLSRIDLSLLPDYLAFFRESFSDRTLMVWMADEEEEQLMRDAGWSASLNSDPENPQIGVFINCTNASKMGWFLNIEPELSEAIVNEDGSRSYRLTVRFSNVITEEEIRQASGYILGGDGNIKGSIYLFAPAGGSISEAVFNDRYAMSYDVYEGLSLSYLANMPIYASNPLTVTALITTAPGVEAVPSLVVTPTMQEYR